MAQGADGGGEPAAGPDGDGAAARASGPALELARLQVDHPEVDRARRELLEELDLRTRRVHQLLGERDQLERQLIRAEKSLQQLSRELGAARPPAGGAPAPAAWPLLRALGDQLRAGLARFRSGEGERKPAPAAKGEAAPGEDRSGALVPFAQGGRRRPVMAVVACGLAPEQRDNVLDVIARQSAAADLVPLVLTDDDDFAPLRRRSMLFEYLPPPAARARFAPALEWDLYLQRRLALLRRKWRPVRVIAFGPSSAELVRLWSESPFEDPALGRLPAAERPPAPGAEQPAGGREPRGGSRRDDAHQVLTMRNCSRPFCSIHSSARARARATAAASSSPSSAARRSPAAAAILSEYLRPWNSPASRAIQ